MEAKTSKTSAPAPRTGSLLATLNTWTFAIYIICIFSLVFTLAWMNSSKTDYLQLRTDRWILQLSNFSETLLSKVKPWIDQNVENTTITTPKPKRPSITTVAIGLGITTRNMKSKPGQSLEDIVVNMPLLRELLTSFCATASSKGYKYHFYVMYDNNDPFFINQKKADQFKYQFGRIAKDKCRHLGEVQLHLLKANHSGRLVWAQNDAMMAAYKDGIHFFYRVNDDTNMISNNWTNIFIEELKKMHPPLVGVVGPNHRGGNLAIMTYDFVHRTHIDIFGYYYPRTFSWWYADDWITKVYEPNRSKKIAKVGLLHTQSLGQRYVNKPMSAAQLATVINNSKGKIDEYLRKTGKNISR